MTPTPEVNVVTHATPHGTASISVTVTVPPPPDLGSLADAVGWASVRPGAVAEGRKKDAYLKWKRLEGQYREIQERIKDAGAASRKLETARAYLIENPEDAGMADKLRKIEADHDHAVARREQAEKDLAVLEATFAKHWAAAATAVQGAADACAMRHLSDLGDRDREAGERLKEAAAAVEAALARAVTQYLVPALGEVLALKRAHAELLNDINTRRGERLADRVVAELLGSPIPGVRRCPSAPSIFEVAPPPPPQAAPVEPAPAPNPRCEIHGAWSAPAADRA